MSGKVRMRCARCGKPFKSANARQTLCSDCEAKERAARAAGKSATTKPVATAPALVQKPKIVGAGAHILDPSIPLAPVAHELPAERQHPSASSHDASPPASPREHAAHNGKVAPPQPPRRPQQHAAGEKKRPPKAPKPPREPQKPYALAAEQRAAVEARYLELASPVEYDGIRTQIATEMSIPKSAVKKVVFELRQRMQVPSWWELQAYKGSEADLERMRQAYLPHLPLPEVGIHKRIAAELGLDQAAAYQAIRRIRAEMRLPQYNPPSLHEPAQATSAGQAASAQPETVAGQPY